MSISSESILPVFPLSHPARVIEVALLVSPDPLSLTQLARLFEGEEEAVYADTVQDALDELQHNWQGRGVELVRLASGWRFRARPEMQHYLDRLSPDKPARYSRAVMEILTIIAYQGPMTRGEIEEIRGVAVSSQALRQLEERGWVESVGHKESPGRPSLYATTRQFLDDLGLASRRELPPLQALGQSEADLGQIELGQALTIADTATPSVETAETLPLVVGVETAAPGGGTGGMGEVQEEETTAALAVPSFNPIEEAAVLLPDGDTTLTLVVPITEPASAADFLPEAVVLEKNSAVDGITEPSIPHPDGQQETEPDTSVTPSPVVELPPAPDREVHDVLRKNPFF